MWYQTVELSKAATLAMLLLAGGTVAAAASGVERGRQFAEENCARCHAVHPRDASPLAAAPPFDTLHRAFSMKALADKLTNGDLGDHPTMPHWLIDPADVQDLVVYIGTIQPHP